MKSGRRGRCEFRAFRRTGTTSKLGIWILAVVALSLIGCTLNPDAATNPNKVGEGQCYWYFRFQLPPEGVYDDATLYRWAYSYAFESDKEPTEIFAWSTRLGLIHKKFPPGQSQFPREPFFADDVAWSVVIKPGRIGDFRYGCGVRPPCDPEKDPVFLVSPVSPMYPLLPVVEARCQGQETGKVLLVPNDLRCYRGCAEPVEALTVKRNGIVSSDLGAQPLCEGTLVALSPLRSRETLFLVVQHKLKGPRAIPATIFQSLDPGKCYQFHFTFGPVAFISGATVPP